MPSPQAVEHVEHIIALAEAEPGVHARCVERDEGMLDVWCDVFFDEGYPISVEYKRGEWGIELYLTAKLLKSRLTVQYRPELPPFPFSPKDAPIGYPRSVWVRAPEGAKISTIAAIRKMRDDLSLGQALDVVEKGEPLYTNVPERFVEIVKDYLALVGAEVTVK